MMSIKPLARSMMMWTTKSAMPQIPQARREDREGKVANTPWIKQLQLSATQQPARLGVRAHRHPVFWGTKSAMTCFTVRSSIQNTQRTDGDRDRPLRKRHRASIKLVL